MSYSEGSKNLTEVGYLRRLADPHGPWPHGGAAVPQAKQAIQTLLDEVDALRLALLLACHDGWADAHGAYNGYVAKATLQLKHLSQFGASEVQR